MEPLKNRHITNHDDEEDDEWSPAQEEEHEEQHEEQARERGGWSPTLGLHPFALGSATFLAAGAFDVIAHLGPTGLVIGGIAAIIAARHGGEIVGQVRTWFLVPPAPLPTPKEQRGAERGHRRIGARLRDHVLEPVQPVYADDADDALPTPEEVDKWADTTRTRLGGAQHDELPVPLPAFAREGTFLFSSVLHHFTPSLNHIYLASTPDGLDLFCTAKELCHVALAGSTGNGKSSLLRLLMAQLCRAGAQVLLLNPHYTKYDLESEEDWTPFEPYLVYDPMECKKYEVIEHYLKYAAEVLLPTRLHRRAQSLPIGTPYFLVIDELPSIVRHIKKAPDYMRSLLEEGRKVGMFLIAAAQDFLVKTIAPDVGGGSLRECYRTAYYVGGDATTARVLLDTEARKLAEDHLGKGQVMLRCAAVLAAKKATLVRVPLVDNGSLYRLLGPSTYHPFSAGQEEEWAALELARPTAPKPASAKVGEMTLDDLLALINQLPDVDPTDSRYGPQVQEHPTNMVQMPVPILKEEGRRAEDIDLAMAIDLWNKGYDSDRKLAKVFGMSRHQGGRLVDMIKERAKKSSDEALDG